jgi:MFS family permease
MHQVPSLTNLPAFQKQNRQPRALTDKEQMLSRIRLLIGISIFWLPLSMLSDGVNTLVLPLQLSGLTNQNNQATILGLLTFVGLMSGALVQPVVGAFSDRLQPVLGRNRFIGIGLILSLVSMFFFTSFQNILGIMASYLAIQVSASIAQAGQQGLIPDLMDENHRGLASGWKGFMDMAGAMLGFAILGQLLGSEQLFLAIGAIATTLIVTYIVAILLTPEDSPTKSTELKPSTISLREIFRLDLTRQTDFIRLLVARFLFLLGIYAVGRFLFLFVAERLGLSGAEAAEQAGNLLAGLALITILASPVTGWLADRFGRLPLMITGAAFSAASALMLIWAANASQILIFGGLMSLGSAAFAGGSWALIADLVPKNESARFFGLANFSVAGSAAVAGLFGPVIDLVDRVLPRQGFTVLFILSSMAFVASAFPLKEMLLEEIRDVRRRNKTRRKDRADASRLAIVSIPADSTALEEDQDPQGGATRL